MYQRSSSSTVESMNAANKSVRDCTAVDPINAMLPVLKLEARRFSKNKEKAWSWHEVLTPHGKKLSDKAFSKVNPRDYTITIYAELDKYVCTVSRMTSNYTSSCWFLSSYDEDDPSLVDAPVEFQTPMAFHALTCVLLSSHTGLTGSMRLM
jgi:hypothetical protein